MAASGLAIVTFAAALALERDRPIDWSDADAMTVLVGVAVGSVAQVRDSQRELDDSRLS